MSDLVRSRGKKTEHCASMAASIKFSSSSKFILTLEICLTNIFMQGKKYYWKIWYKSKISSSKVVMDLEQISPNLQSFFIRWTARSMERSIFFFLKIHISAPGERNCPNFFFWGSFPIIFSCYKWFLSRLGPLHGQNWKNVSKKCLFGCPKPKSLKMTNLE